MIIASHIIELAIRILLIFYGSAGLFGIVWYAGDLYVLDALYAVSYGIPAVILGFLPMRSYKKSIWMMLACISTAIAVLACGIQGAYYWLSEGVPVGLALEQLFIVLLFVSYLLVIHNHRGH
ncbi:MAG: hypothetical protein WDZ76_06275 [Pseudohongiellaceae bacterium]